MKYGKYFVTFNRLFFSAAISYEKLMSKIPYVKLSPVKNGNEAKFLRILSSS